MSDEPIHPELDGTGGGFGKFPGLTVRQLSEQFRQICEEPNMRSFSAILRISREQLEARGSLGMYRSLAILFSICGAVLGVAIPFVPKDVHATFVKGAIAGLIIGSLFAGGVYGNRHATRAALAQERAIRDLAVDALVQIADDPSFVAKPLDDDQQRILRELLKYTKRSEPKLSAMVRD